MADFFWLYCAPLVDGYYLVTVNAQFLSFTRVPLIPMTWSMALVSFAVRFLLLPVLSLSPNIGFNSNSKAVELSYCQSEIQAKKHNSPLLYVV